VTVASYVFGIVSASVVVLAVFELLRRRHVRERHAIWWIVASVLALLVSIFPGLLESVAAAVGVAAPTNLVFFLGIVILFLLSVQQSAEATVLEEKTRTLAEEVSFLRERVLALESAGEPPLAESEHEEKD
jgi:hypothetical protein